MSPSLPPQLGQPSPNPPSQPPKICLDPVDLDFGTMDPNTNQTLQITVSNCGGQQLHWSTGGGGLELDPRKGTLDSNQSQPIKVTLNTGSVKLNPGPNILLVRFNSSDGNSIDLIVTVTLKVTLKRREWRARTGFGEKTLWDWSQLLIIPIFLLIATLVFGLIQNAISFQMSASQHEHDNLLAADQQRETEIKSYLDSMSTLLENPNLRDPQKGVDLRSLAQAQTLIILRELGQDGVRKAVVVHFLHDAGLFTRDPSPIVNLAGADLSWAMLNGINLGGADLAAADLTRANLTGTYLSGASLHQATLKGADLTGANLDFAQLTNTDLTCADPHDPKTCTKLANADLSGADFAGANLAGAIFNHTEVTGTYFPNGFAQELTGGKAFTRKWRVFQQDNILKIDHNDGSLLPTYGQLDLNTSKLQLVYGPSGNFGTSLVLLPAVWSRTSCPGDYCETASVTYSYSQDDLSVDRLGIGVTGTIAGIPVVMGLSFCAPRNNTFSVDISAQTQAPCAASTHPQYPCEPAIDLDQNVSGGAFKPIILHSMHVTSSQWSAQKASIENQPPFPLLRSGQITLANVSTFELVGGTSDSIINAPTITVKSIQMGARFNPIQAAVTLEMKPAASKNDNNVGMWAWVGIVLDEWSYTVAASMPPS